MGFLQNIKKEEEFLKLCQYMELETFQKESVVFRQNEPGDKFYLVLRGSAKVYVQSESEVSHFKDLVFFFFILLNL